MDVTINLKQIYKFNGDDVIADALPVHARPSFRLPEVMRNTTSAMLTFTI